MAHWVVQNNIRDEASYESFIQALDEYAVPYTIVKVIPFSHETIPDVDLQSDVLVWGSTTLDLVAKHKGWNPGTFLNENFDQRIWLRAFGNHMLNADAEFHSFCSIPQFEGVRFIRPVHDMKTFAGTLIDGTNLERWQHSILDIGNDYSTLRPSTPVSVSSVKEILTEYRFFVVDRHVVAGSTYRHRGKSFVERIEPEPNRGINDYEDAWQFAQRMADLWQPAVAFVIDIAAIDNPYGCNCFQFKVIEINCINSAGFYAADMHAVVKAIHTIV
jgi:hypothetical protein